MVLNLCPCVFCLIGRGFYLFIRSRLADEGWAPSLSPTPIAAREAGGSSTGDFDRMERPLGSDTVGGRRHAPSINFVRIRMKRAFCSFLFQWGWGEGGGIQREEGGGGDLIGILVPGSVGRGRQAAGQGARDSDGNSVRSLLKKHAHRRPDAGWVRPVTWSCPVQGPL